MKTLTMPTSLPLLRRRWAAAAAVGPPAPDRCNLDVNVSSP